MRDVPVAEVIAVRPRMRGLSHYYAFFISLATGAVLVATAPRGLATWTALVYALSVSAMLGASSLLHRGSWTRGQARILTKLDHTCIYLLIAGTYTPISLIAMSGVIRVLVFSVVWLGAFVGIALEWVWYRPPRGWVTTNYIVVGWVALIALPQLWTSLGVGGFLLVLLGGVSYTVGAVIHAARRPDPWPEVFGYHELFHVFVLVALVLHFAAIAFVVLPKG
ncbi:MAG TPA: hemolysin III family protein [Acidimicrobiia bacterium]|nr:hemolysin III family protein [Acidimicrobiia bacterium]